MEKLVEERLRKIVKLYFSGYTVVAAIEETTEKEPSVKGPHKILQ